MVMNKRLWLILSLEMLAIFFVLPFSSALDNPCVEASVTDISPSSIGIGEEFTIGIQFESCSSQMPDFVQFELINPPTDIFIKEPLIVSISQLYYGNSERFITYHMKTAENAHPGEYVIKTRLSYGVGGSSVVKNDEITFEVIGEKAELSIASVKTKPVLPVKKDMVELTLRIENTGEGTAKSIKIYADHPFQGVKQTFIGSLELNEDGPAIFTFIANKSGNFEFPVTISYVDDFGENDVKTNVEISILEKESNLQVIAFFLIILIIVGGGFFYFIKKSKAKDKIIHQLLNGNHPHKKSGK